ncbi:MAG TPA: hypothetical protein VFG20_05105 [Planctomycetaceae bacterium]|nr:hypothetical protein [Planctomycetaceae bacterium]
MNLRQQKHVTGGGQRLRLQSIITLVASFVLGAPLVSRCDAMTVDEAIAAHAATLARIQTVYVNLEIQLGPTEKPPQRMSTTESWRVGSRERTLQRVYFTLTTQGLKDVSEADRVAQFSYGDSETRTLRGWDPAAPLTVPLDETRDSTEFGRVKGGIGPRDPLGGTSDDWTTLLLEVARGVPLAQFAKTAQLQLVETAKTDIVRLKVIETDQPQLVNAVIDLDPAHGYLIRRLESPKTSTVAEVDGFTSFGEGIWLPDRVRRIVPRATAVAERVAARVNEPIADSELVVQFPEGARVDEVLTKRVYLWGNDGPAETFESFPLFHEHQLKRMKLAQQTPENLASGGTNWLLWVNVVGIVVLLMLMKFRNRLVEQ